MGALVNIGDYKSSFRAGVRFSPDVENPYLLEVAEEQVRNSKLPPLYVFIPQQLGYLDSRLFPGHYSMVRKRAEFYMPEYDPAA